MRAFIKLFLVSVKIIILITLFWKIIILFEHPHVLDLTDDVTGMKFATLTIAAVIFEIVLLVVLWSVKNFDIQTWAVLYFGLITGAYRMLAHKIGQQWCPCLGSFGSWADLSEKQVSVILNIVVIYLLAGALTTLVMITWQKVWQVKPLSPPVPPQNPQSP